MQPTFEENDFILVDKISPRLSQWQRGDVIVFVPPHKDFPYIKRIIGLPGETIKIEEGHVYVCQHSDDPLDKCEMLNEQYLPNGLNTEARCTKNVFEVDQSGVFVLGDNRWYSTDSRCCFGLWCYQWAQYVVPYDHIIGKVRVRVFPRFDFY